MEVILKRKTFLLKIYICTRMKNFINEGGDLSVI